MLTLLFPLLCTAQPSNSNTLQSKALLAVKFMDKYHYQPLVWNDSSSARLYKKWMNTLDDEKLFFTQKEVDQLKNYTTTLDDELNGKGWRFFDVSTQLLQQQIKKADSIVTSFLSKPVDFSKVDNLEWPQKNYAINDALLAKRWQQYLKWQLLSRITNKYIEQKIILSAVPPADFNTVEQQERSKLKVKEKAYLSDLLQTPALFLSDKQDEYLNDIVWCYDPHSNYFNLKEKEAFTAEVSAMEYTTGFTFNTNDKGDKTIDFLQPGGSAWQSGQLHKGDVLLKIEIASKEMDVTELSNKEVVAILKSAGNNEIALTVRTVANEIKKVVLTQQIVSDDEEIVKSFVIKDAFNIGYINLPGFYNRDEGARRKNQQVDGCANDISKEILKLKKDNISGLILDLRNNGGGSIWEAMQLAGIFIDAGPVASIKERDGKAVFLKDPNRGTIYDGPLMVLINGASASASEFLSATLQDYNRALIVGGVTYGKGTGQEILPLDTSFVGKKETDYADFIKVTNMKFYRINGNTVQWKGVIPDILLPDIYADISFKEKVNESALLPDTSKMGFYKPLEGLPTKQLKLKSEERIKQNSYFKNITTASQFLANYQNGTTVPLQWQTYTAYNKNNKELFSFLNEDEKAVATLLKVENNSFDKERISLGTTTNKKTNDTYIKNINTDNEIAEACKIFYDWISK
ncbi:carboxy terminal-processing peptidase [Ferruginibacter yonginensis]|uniref:Carboxy terminal-processing peptidase n=1 Tax=Ferruginibacter yonginensis TaxID=1310416 RepID=A0ABV8QQS3_9BACT